tara:strand:- start:5217 stop:5693 length:477 start_codon:yes stop_codon:yes gene_type:complete
MKNEFIESKKLNLRVVQLLLVLLLGFSVYALVLQIFTEATFANKDIPNWVLGLGIFLLLGLIASFASLKLDTKVNQDGIKVSFGILANEEWPWAEIKKAQVQNFSFVGFGKRKSPQYGTVLSTGGKQGLAIELKNGEKWLIDIKNRKDLEKLLKSLKT